MTTKHIPLNGTYNTDLGPYKCTGNVVTVYGTTNCRAEEGEPIEILAAGRLYAIWPRVDGYPMMFYESSGRYTTYDAIRAAHNRIHAETSPTAPVSPFAAILKREQSDVGILVVMRPLVAELYHAFRTQHPQMHPDRIEWYVFRTDFGTPTEGPYLLFKYDDAVHTLQVASYGTIEDEYLSRDEMARILKPHKEFTLP